MADEKKNADGTENRKPDLVARVREGYGRQASFNTVGVGWTKPDGSIYFKPYGKQIVDSGIYLFKQKSDE